MKEDKLTVLSAVNGIPIFHTKNFTFCDEWNPSSSTVNQTILKTLGKGSRFYMDGQVVEFGPGVAGYSNDLGGWVPLYDKSNHISPVRFVSKVTFEVKKYDAPGLTDI